MRLPEDVLLRSDGAGVRSNHYGGRIYLAVSAWTSQEEAQVAAASIRDEGRLARVVPSPRPVAYMPAIDRLSPTHEAYLGRPWRRHKKTQNRWMWLVFAAEPAHTEIAAHAGGRTGVTP